MSKKQKRYEYHITYDAKAKMWVCKVGGAIFRAENDRDSLGCVVAWDLDYWSTAFGQRSELIIHRKDGTIGKGSSSRRTYGADPKSRG